MNSIRAYWHVCDNFGDALTPYLIKEISGKNAKYVQANSRPPAIMVTGSILGSGVHRATVWGTGCAFESDLDPNCFTSPSDEFNIIATRGLLSKALVEKSGHKPIAFGDPSILLPRFYQSSVTKRFRVGIICSWVDYDEVVKKYAHKGISIINSMQQVEMIIDRICECDTIVASVLHGLIAAISYEIPSVLVKFSDKMIGDGFKFRDFLTCTDKLYEPFDLIGSTLDIEELIGLTSLHKLTVDGNALFDCCPFKQ